MNNEDLVKCNKCHGRKTHNLEKCNRCDGSGELPRDVVVHWTHCYQSEYKGSCKYGDDDCPARVRRRYNYVGVPETLILDQQVYLLNKAFGEVCYQVGSSTERTTYRDVDVRMIMDDKKFDALFGERGGSSSLFWSIMCASISEWLNRRTGLPVDFQIQRRTECNQQHNGVRNGMGMFTEDYVDTKHPQWRRIDYED